MAWDERALREGPAVKVTMKVTFTPTRGEPSLIAAGDRFRRSMGEEPAAVELLRLAVALETGPRDREILVVGAPNLGEAPKKEIDGRRHWWADQPGRGCQGCADLGSDRYSAWGTKWGTNSHIARHGPRLGLITRRSQVRILPPLFHERHGVGHEQVEERPPGP